jgi:hypothetical protein
MKMHVQVQRAAKALHQGDRTALPRAPCKPGFADQESADRAVHDPQCLTHRGRIAGEQEAQRKGNTQHPLTHRHRGQHLIDQQRRTLHHAPGAATGTEAAALAAEGDQFLGAAFGTAHPQEPVFQSATLQIFFKFPPYKLRQSAPLRHDLRKKIRVVVIDDPVEQRLLGPVA